MMLDTSVTVNKSRETITRAVVCRYERFASGGEKEVEKYWETN